MNLKEFRILYPSANFIDDEDAEEIIARFNEEADYRQNHILDIESEILFYEALYSGNGNINEQQ